MGSPGPRGSRPRTVPAAAAATPNGSGLLLLFLITLCIPGTFSVVVIQLSLYKTLLLVTTIPLAVLWIRGRAGPVVATDLLVLGFAVWQVLSLGMHHGITRIPYMGTTFVETFGAYLMGRMLVVNAARFLSLFRYLLLCFAVLLPFALIELLTGQRLWRTIFGTVLNMGVEIRHERRMGLSRVILGFPHPIHMGFVASVAVANVYYIFAGRWFRRLGLLGLVGGMTFVGLSSGPMLSAVLQGVMIAWDRIVRFLSGHWLLFGLIGVVSLTMLQMTLPGGIVGYLVNEVIFNPYGGANRIDIFDYGLAEVKRNPLLGIGLNEWRRPFWQHATLDNFWLLVTMRYGIPGFLLLAGAIAMSGLSIASAQGLSPTEARYRTGYLIALVGSVVVLGTVHIWESPAAFFMTYIGAGVWFYSARETADDPSADTGRAGAAAARRAASRPAAAGPCGGGGRRDDRRGDRRYARGDDRGGRGRRHPGARPCGSGARGRRHDRVPAEGRTPGRAAAPRRQRIRSRTAARKMMAPRRTMRPRTTRPGTMCPRPMGETRPGPFCRNFRGKSAPCAAPRPAEDRV